MNTFDKSFVFSENVNNLFHVYNNYNLTESAKSQFSKNIHKWSSLYCLIKKNIE